MESSMTYYFKTDDVEYVSVEGVSCKGCAFDRDRVGCDKSQYTVKCPTEDIIWIKKKVEPQEPQEPQESTNLYIAAPYPQAYIIMDKTDNTKSWQFKGPRIYVKYEEAKKLCDNMNRHIKDKVHVVVGFDLVNGGEVYYV
jgi:hypothetical protein